MAAFAITASAATVWGQASYAPAPPNARAPYPPQVAAATRPAVTLNGNNVPLAPDKIRPEYGLAPWKTGHPLVLMAISGGGSRSAYYAARVMEQLSCVGTPGGSSLTMADGHTTIASMMDSVRIISSISAGGLAASYYVVNYDQRRTPGFFSRMQDAMAVNLQWRTYGHMVLFPPAAVQLLASNVTRTDLLAEEIGKLIGCEDMTFDGLLSKELRGTDPAPRLIINGTIYNSGQRLAMTNIPPHRFPSLANSASPQPRVTISETDRQLVHDLVQPMTFEDIGSDIGLFRLSKALAASAAYPIVLAPVPLHVFPSNVPYHLYSRSNAKLLESPTVYIADGGVYENEGLDPLVCMLKTVPRSQPVLLVVVDGSQRMETMVLGDGKIWGPTSSMSRMYDIGTMRPLAFYNQIVAQFHDSSKLETVFIRMEGYDEASEKTLKNIPTSFKLSAKHRETLDKVAEINVRMMVPALSDAYRRLMGRTRHENQPKTQKKSAVKTAAKLHHDVAPAQ